MHISPTTSSRSHFGHVTASEQSCGINQTQLTPASVLPKDPRGNIFLNTHGYAIMEHHIYMNFEDKRQPIRAWLFGQLQATAPDPSELVSFAEGSISVESSEEQTELGDRSLRDSVGMKSSFIILPFPLSLNRGSPGGMG